MLKKLLKTLGAVVLVIVMAIFALFSYMFYANKKADETASTFCSTIRVGSSSEAVLASAAQSGCRMWNIEDKNGYRFAFQGAPFHQGVCYVNVSNGKVISSNFTGEGD